MQGIIVTVWDAILTFGGGTDNVSFLAAVSLTVVIYLLCYILIFISYFKLIYRYSTKKRTYNAPGGKIGKTMLAFSGLALSIFALIVSFVTPATLSPLQGRKYQVVLTVSFVIAVIIPFVIYAFRHRFGEANHQFKLRHVRSEDVNRFIHPIGRGEFLTEHDLKLKRQQKK